MNMAMALLLLTFVATIVFQAVLPRHRLGIILTGCTACSVLATTTGETTMHELWRGIPWNVIAILVALNLFTQLVMPSNVLGYLALKASKFSRGCKLRLLWVFPAMMFVLSGTMNNLATMNVMLPILLATLKILAPEQRYVDMIFAAVLVATNLGGAATPIGDFPAILLMGHGGVEFTTYLVWAGPACVAILLLVLLAFLVLHGKKRQNPQAALEELLAVHTVAKLYRRTRVRWAILLPSVLVFVGMFACWTMGVEPDLVCMVGVAILLLALGERGEKTIRSGIEVEPVVFLISLFIMIGAVTATGILEVLTQPILGLSSSPRLMLVVFLVVAGLLTGLFSAGPSMAALLPIATVLTEFLPSEPVYVGLALAVCAGSSLFITAATSGVLAQEQVDASGLVTADGRLAQFGFLRFAPYGAMSFCIILSAGIAYVLAFC